MRAAILALLLLGCSGQKPRASFVPGVSTATGVATSVVAAVAASAGSRALGGCYAICQQGEVCNRNSGLCDVVPCRGLCGAGERCESGFLGDKCVQSGDGLSATSKSAAPASAAGAIRIETKPPVPDAARP
jgi:hypothetical protein